MLGFVLAGGAARGAYQAGVLRFLFDELGPRLNRMPWPEVVSGTSVGALNASFVAAGDVRAVGRLSELWRKLTIDQVFRVTGSNVVRVLRSLVQPVPGVALLDPSPLYGTVAREHPLGAVRRRIDSGELRAFIVSATRLETGHNELFVDTRAQVDLKPTANARVRRVHMDPSHLLASSALPLLFPPVKVGERTYVDGGLRANTPLRPVIRCGADRNVILGGQARATRPREGITPTLPFLAGKTLNALMLDPVARDLSESDLINRIATWGRERYGQEFVEHLEREVGVRPVQNLFLRPSQDLGRLAARSYVERPPKADASVRRLLDFLVDKPNLEEGESDMLSYVYFDRGFTEQAEQLGFEDARDQQHEIAAFLEPSA